MSYLGNPPTSAAFVTDTFNGTGSQTAYTMSVAPASTASMLVIVGAVLQDPSTYSIVGMTLNFSAAPPSGTGNISVRYMGIPAAGVANTAYRTVTDFTATAGQTTITVPSYTVGFIDVFRNGARLGNTDFTATNGTSITLALAANANDLITTVSFSISSVLNAIPNTAGAVQAVNLAPGAARANWGAGGVLNQYAVYVPQGAVSTFNDAYANAPTLATTTQYTTITVTPTAANSNFLIEFKGNIDSDGGAAGAGEFICLFIGSTLVGCSYQYRRCYGSEPVMHYVIAPYTNAGSSAFTVSLRVKSSASYNLFFNKMATYTSDDRNSYFKITEIAA